MENVSEIEEKWLIGVLISKQRFWYSQIFGFLCPLYRVVGTSKKNFMKSRKRASSASVENF